MRRFLRNLTIKEREGIASSICYFSFLGLHLISIKYLATVKKIDFLTIVTSTGSMVSLISIYRILMSTKKINQNNIEETLLIFNGGIFAFFTFAGTIASLYWISLNKLILILRLYPFLFLVYEYISNSYQIPQHIINCFIFNIICILFNLLNALDEQGPGIFIGLFSIISKVISTKYWKKSTGIKIDLMMFSIAFYSVGIGGYINMTFLGGKYNLDYFDWFLTVLNAFFIYYSRIFVIKVVSSIINVDKIIIMNFFCLNILFFVDFVFFDVKFHISDVIIFLIGIDSIYFIKKLIDRSKMDKIKKLNYFLNE